MIQATQQCSDPLVNVVLEALLNTCCTIAAMRKRIWVIVLVCSFDEAHFSTTDNEQAPTQTSHT